MDEIISEVQGWFTSFTSQFSGTTVMIGLLGTYLYLWYMVERAKKAGWTLIHFPFGIKIEMSNLVEMYNSDAMVIAGIYESIQQLEFKARARMRQVMNRVCGKWIKSHPQYTEYIIRGKLSFAYAISDNHIVYSLARKRIGEYIDNKLEQLLESVGEDISDNEDAVCVLGRVTEDFVYHIIPVQEKLCYDKLEVYEKALLRLQTEGQRVQCQAKVQKNKGYIESLSELSSTIIHKAADSNARASIDTDIDEQTGASVMAQAMANIEQIAKEMKDNGKH